MKSRHFEAVGAACLLASCAVLSQTPKRSYDPEKHVVGDVRETIKTKQLKEGLNEINKDTESGLILFATVKRGQVTGYSYTDDRGQKVPGQLKVIQPGDKCYFCIQRGDHIACTRVPCPKNAPKPRPDPL